MAERILATTQGNTSVPDEEPAADRSADPEPEPLDNMAVPPLTDDDDTKGG